MPTEPSDTEQFDFLVVGSGIAGLTFALKAIGHGSVCVVTKQDLPESNTAYAQGGIAASVGEMDSWSLHEQDTLTAGAGLCDPDAVRLVVREAPRLVHWLIDIGAQFDRTPGPDGLPQLALGREGGHSRNRILHSADRTGWEIMRALAEATRSQPDILVREYCSAVRLSVRDGECLGAWVWDARAQRLVAIRARAVVLATGGCGQVYRYTTNPPIATGDGIAIARRAGAVLANMEFMQFHPTSLYHPHARAFLISERVRGEGARLINAEGKRFMEGLHPMAELAPRDIVARAIDTEMKRTGAECVYLDMSHLPAERIRDLFPMIYERCLSVGLDISREPIPVTPAAHYSCGGVWTDLWGRTSISRLYACGEVACNGLHGANRLASNSLLEALVFGERAAIQAAELPPVQGSLPDEAGKPLPSVGPDPGAVRTGVQNVMWQDVGIVRTDVGLQRALLSLQALAGSVGRPATTGTVAEQMEAANLLTCGEAIVQCALMRRESRGGHFNADCPDRDDLRWSHPTLLGRSESQPQ